MEDSRLPGARLAVAHGNPPQIPRPEPVSGSHPTAGGWAVMSAVCREEVRNPGRGDTGRRYGAPLGGAPLGAEWCVAAGGDSHCTRCGGRGDRTHSTDLVRVASEAADGGEESNLMDSRKATRLVTCSRGRQAGGLCSWSPALSWLPEPSRGSRGWQAWAPERMVLYHYRVFSGSQASTFWVCRAPREASPGFL